MILKPYGNTGKQVSVIGFGGMRFPQRADAPADATPEQKYDHEACAAIVVDAYNRGVNYFDTAPYYCDDQSELIMGRAIREMQRINSHEFFVSTKSSEKDGAKLRAQLETSLKRLNVEKITFFHIWCILTMDDYRSRMVPGGGWEAAMKAKEEGLIEHVVFSSHCSGAEIAEIVEEGHFEGLTIGYNILNFPFRQKGIEAAHRHGLGVVTMNPLGGGTIPQNRSRFEFLKDAADQDIVEAAIRFNAAHKEISVVLPGMSSHAEVAQNCDAGDRLVPLTASRKDDIAAHLNNALDSMCTGCQYCLPCPADVQIPKYMMSWNQSIWGKPQDAINQLKWHWGIKAEGAAACIECGVCETRCTQHLPIIARLKDIVAWGEKDAAATAAAAAAKA